MDPHHHSSSNHNNNNHHASTANSAASNGATARSSTSNAHHTSSNANNAENNVSKRQSSSTAATATAVTNNNSRVSNINNVTALDPHPPNDNCIPAWRNYDFKLQSWEAVAFWKWELEVDTCPICRNQIMDLCIECQGKYEGVMPTETEEADCSIAWGMCNHAFHMHCISRWLKNRNVCPLDNQTWEYSRIGR